MLSGDALAGALPKAQWMNWRPLEVQRIQCDSRKVSPGDLFVAIPGVSVDGHAFVADALRRGAVACVVERVLPELAGVPAVLVPNAREALAHLHAAWRGFPAHHLRVIGVTGTDGKTTTVRLITGILRAAGHPTGRVDSVSAAIGGVEVSTGFHTTTPDAPEMQAYLAEMVRYGMEYAVIESTSHGLAQDRVAACAYDVAVVTNITHEHLDYHGSYEAYREAKAKLFRYLATSPRKPGMAKVSVLNADDSSYAYLRDIPADVQISYGLRDALVTAKDLAASPKGLRCTVRTPGGTLTLESPLVGRYNVYNILAAVSVAHSQELDPETVRAGVAGVSGVTGRMERIDRGQPFTVIVDFAHTPNALENALRTGRDLAEGRALSVVFGCAGLRDRLKRPWMGEIAARLADRVYITAEDPRTESLDAIMAEIAEGCRQAGGQDGETYWRIGDREEAIAAALGAARPGDVVIVTGKGHEQSMCFGTTEYPWSDHAAVLRGLDRLGHSAPKGP